MRDYALILFFLVLLPFCLQRPYVSILVWSWFGYMNPHRLTWGIAYGFPFSQIIAFVAIISIAKEMKSFSFPWERETILLLLLWFMFFLTTIFALNPEGAWEKLDRVSKILFMTCMTMYVINDKEKLRLLILVIALSLGYFGFKGGLFSLLSAGQFRVYGPPDSFIAENNGLALALNMALPLLYYLAKEEQSQKLKLLFKSVFALTILAVLFTYSRGGFLGLMVVASAVFLRMKLSGKLLVGAFVLILLPPLITVMPDQWLGRMQTIETYESDGSAMSRIEAWKLAWRIGLARPLTGAGFQAMEDERMYDLYYPEATLRHDVHSVYFEALGECGFVTLGILLLLMGSCILSLRGLRKRARNNPALQWLDQYSHMVQISLYAYMVCGAFLELLSFDLFYHLVSIVVILKTLEKRALATAELLSGASTLDRTLRPRKWGQRAVVAAQT